MQKKKKVFQEVQIISHSKCGEDELVTFRLKYWRAIHAELMTHRVFSRNASSSRAIPVRKVLKQVWSDPASPQHWGKNQRGMQAKGELTGLQLIAAKALWKLAGRLMCVVALVMVWLNLHKQVANRILEPWQYITVLVTSSEWSNFFELRAHEDAQPEFQLLANEMLEKLNNSTPMELYPGEWHMPYTDDLDDKDVGLAEYLATSTARCCRVSYNTIADGLKSTLDKDIKLHDRLIAAKPEHASPTEHQALAVGDGTMYYNLRGWKSYRYLRDTKAVVLKGEAHV